MEDYGRATDVVASYGNSTLRQMDGKAPPPPPRDPLMPYLDKVGSEMESRISALAENLEQLHSHVFGSPMNAPSDVQIGREPSTADESVRLRFVRALDYLARAESIATQLNGRLL